MTKTFFSLAEAAAILRVSRRALAKRAEVERWREQVDLAQHLPGKTRFAWQYHISLYSCAEQARLAIHAAPANDDVNEAAARRKALWSRFEALSKGQKEVCRQRLAAIETAERLRQGGLSPTAAVLAACREHSIRKTAFFDWKAKLRSLPREDWLAALAPAKKGNTDFAECHPEAWAALKSDFLRPEKPGFSACYRRVAKAAKAEGWAPMPSERALRRRLDAEVPRAVQVLARDGRDKAKGLYPAQRRTRMHLHAMELVNMDGHRLDVFVRLPADNTGRERIGRVHLIGLQDLLSGKILAWRLSETENKETVRLVVGDMVERHGIPDGIYFDNGRAFASKWITGGARNRYRFKVREEDPRGLITALGIDLHWTLPYAGQSKPIERSWRDVAEEVSKHPFCAGAYTGNKPDAKPENYASRAIPLDALHAHVARQIAELNARPGRRAPACAGRSFDATFEASLAEPSTLVKWPSPAQAALWLLAAERIRCRKGSGEIHLFGNRYWAPPLNAHAGKLVTVRFDPEKLSRPVKVYDGDDKLICDAEPVVDVRFDDAGKARIHARNRNELIKATREQMRLHRVLSADELAQLYDGGPLDERPAKPARPPKVQRLATGGLAIKQPSPEVTWDDQAEENFSKGLRRINAGVDNIINFEAPKSSEYGAALSAVPAGRKPSRQAYGENKSGEHGARRKK